MCEKVFLVQTDTTVGFLSKSQKRLNFIKKRALDTPCLKSVATFKELKFHVRVPNAFKRMVRNRKSTTFIYPSGEALRVIQEPKHKAFIKQHGWLYSTSANKSGKGFDENYAREAVDEVIENKRGFFEAKPSNIIKLGTIRKKKVRV